MKNKAIILVSGISVLVTFTLTSGFFMYLRYTEQNKVAIELAKAKNEEVEKLKNSETQKEALIEKLKTEKTNVSSITNEADAVLENPMNSEWLNTTNSNSKLRNLYFTNQIIIYKTTETKSKVFAFYNANDYVMGDFVRISTYELDNNTGELKYINSSKIDFASKLNSAEKFDFENPDLRYTKVNLTYTNKAHNLSMSVTSKPVDKPRKNNYDVLINLNSNNLLPDYMLTDDFYIEGLIPNNDYYGSVINGKLQLSFNVNFRKINFAKGGKTITVKITDANDKEIASHDNIIDSSGTVKSMSIPADSNGIQIASPKLENYKLYKIKINSTDLNISNFEIPFYYTQLN